MAEINRTSSVPTWPSNRVVNSSQNGKHSPKQYKKNNESNDESVDSADNKDRNLKKRSPGSSMNSHIDEYA